MRCLYPEPQDDVDPVVAYGVVGAHATGRPSVRLNMISSADGAAALAGRSGTLGGTADKNLFALLRSLADVILVGAGTMRAEGYGPARLGEASRTRRRAEGMALVPPIAVMTRSCRLAWEAPFFTDAESRPIVVTTSGSAAGDRERAATVADVVVAGEASVDLSGAMDALGARGHTNVLAEGGPVVAAELAGADLLDELCLTLAPLLTAGPAHRILDGRELAPPRSLGLEMVLEADGYLFLRYRRH
jgi:riboflavin biosynthesis pyrimidine reductase